MAEQMRQWIVHPDGTWIWSADRPIGQSHPCASRGSFKPYELPDANTHHGPWLNIYAIRMAGATGYVGYYPGNFSTYAYDTLVYVKTKTPVGDGREWMLYDVRPAVPPPEPEPSQYDTLKTALRELVAAVRTSNGYLTFEQVEASLKAERLLADG